MRALGFSLGMAGASPPLASGFDPRRLFAAGEAGAWYDPGEPSSVFGEPVGTAQAAADAAVARVADRSGRGNDAVQPNAAARPILRREAGGPDGRGRAYLAFDGADDWLGCAAAELAITGPCTLAFACRRGAAGTHDIWMSAQTNAAETNPYELRTNPSGGVEFVASDVEPFEVSSAGTAVPVGADRVVVAVRTGTEIAFDVGGIATRVPHRTVPKADARTEFQLGSRKGVPLFANGRIYGALVIARVLTPAEVAGLRGFLGARAGIAA